MIGRGYRLEIFIRGPNDLHMQAGAEFAEEDVAAILTRLTPPILKGPKEDALAWLIHHVIERLHVVAMGGEP